MNAGKNTPELFNDRNRLQEQLNEQSKLGEAPSMYWLDLAMKLNNVAARTQCTKHLTWTISGFTTICNLALHPGGQFERIFIGDKVGRETYPVAIPLGRTLSYFMGLYLLNNKRKIPEVFHGWKNITFEKKWGVSSKEARLIGAAGMALAVNLDREKLETIGTINRHSVNVMETNYLTWTNYDRLLSTDVKLTPLVQVSDKEMARVAELVDKAFLPHHPASAKTPVTPLINMEFKKDSHYLLDDPVKFVHPRCCGNKVVSISKKNTAYWTYKCKNCRSMFLVKGTAEIPANLVAITNDAPEVVPRLKPEQSELEDLQVDPEKVFMGIDASPNAVAITSITDWRLKMYYWSDKEVNTGSIDAKYMGPVDMESVTMWVNAQDKSRTVLGLEDELPAGKDVNEVQRMFTAGLREKIKLKVLRVDNLNAKRAWLISDWKKVAINSLTIPDKKWSKKNFSFEKFTDEFKVEWNMVHPWQDLVDSFIVANFTLKNYTLLQQPRSFQN